MLRKHFTHTVTISRGVVTGNKTNHAAVATLVPCHIQPISPLYQNGEWGRIQKEYLMLSSVEVRVGDKITDQDDVEYDVFGASYKNFRGKSHYACQLRSA